MELQRCAAGRFAPLLNRGFLLLLIAVLFAGRFAPLLCSVLNRGFLLLLLLFVVTSAGRAAASLLCDVLNRRFLLLLLLFVVASAGPGVRERFFVPRVPAVSAPVPAVPAEMLGGVLVGG